MNEHLYSDSSLLSEEFANENAVLVDEPVDEREKRHIHHPGAGQIFLRNFLFAHPVLVRGLALAPALIATIDARNSIVLALMFLILTLSPSLFAAIARDSIPKAVRVPVYVLLAAAAYIPAYYLLQEIPFAADHSLGIFLPLLPVSSFVYSKAEKESLTLPWYSALFDTFCGALTFGLFAFVLASIREIFGAGQFMGISLNITPIPGLQLPFAGCLLAGFLAAGMQLMIRLLIRQRKTQSVGGEENE